MAEIRRGFGGEPLGSERLPWLEPVEDEDDFPETGGGGGGGRVALWLVIGLVVIATSTAAVLLAPDIARNAIPATGAALLRASKKHDDNGGLEQDPHVEPQ